MIVLFVLALSWLAAAVGLLARSAEAATSFTMVLMFIPYVQHRVRAGPHYAGRLERLRPLPAVHADHRDHARPVDGSHLYRCRRWPRGVHRRRLLRRHPRSICRNGFLAVPESERGVRTGHCPFPLRRTVVVRLDRRLGRETNPRAHGGVGSTGSMMGRSRPSSLCVMTRPILVSARSSWLRACLHWVAVQFPRIPVPLHVYRHFSVPEVATPVEEPNRASWCQS